MASVLSVPLQDDVTANLGSNSFEVQTDPRGSQRSGRRSGGSQRAAMAEVAASERRRRQRRSAFLICVDVLE